jgi:ABC-type bacteriocin/lantibiotic exporter with double-glycine peptidase domain
MRQVRPLIRRHVASFFCVSAGSILALLSPLLLRWLIDTILPQRRAGLLLVAVLLIFVGHEGRVVLTSLGGYVTLGASQKLTLNLRIALLQHLNTLSADYYDRTSAGVAMYPLKEPIDEIAYFGSDLLPAILRLLLTTAVTIVGMSILNRVLTIAVVPLIPMFLVTRQYFRAKLAAQADAAQQERLAWSHFLEEHLSAAISIQLLGQVKRQERRAFHQLARATRTQMKLFQTASWFTVGSSFAIAMAMAAVIGSGGMQVLRGRLSVGTVIAFYGFVTQLFDPLSGAAELYARTQRTFASIRQVQNVLSLVPSVTNAHVAVALSGRQRADIEFRGVEFRYAGNQSRLWVPSWRVAAGDHIAIAGENGSGKSTLAKLIARLYDPLQGTVTLAGQDVKNIDLRRLRRAVSYLSRDPALFDGSILSNLLFVCPEASSQDLERALQATEMADFVASLPDGLGQRIGPDGCQLSGGERQRLALARALLQRPQVLILDEATSCLDPATETKVLYQLRCHLPLCSLILISHRQSTFSTFGRTIFLSQGRIISDGNAFVPVLSRHRVLG